MIFFIFDIDNQLYIIYNKNGFFSIYKTTHFMDKTTARKGGSKWKIQEKTPVNPII